MRVSTNTLKCWVWSLLLVFAVLQGLTQIAIANSELVDQGIHFVAERDPNALNNRRYVADGTIVQPVVEFGKTQVFTGGRIENFLGDGIGQSIYPARQRRGVAFVAAKRRMLSSTVVEVELGSFLGERDAGAHAIARAELDLEAIQLRAAVAGEVYRLKEEMFIFGDQLSRFQPRTIADVSLVLRGLGPLPDESELEFESHLEHDFGHAFETLALTSPTFAEASLKFTTPFAGSGDLFDEDPESRLTIEAFTDTLNSFDVKANALWFLQQTRSWDLFANFEAVYQRNGKRSRNEDLVQLLGLQRQKASFEQQDIQAWAKAGLEGIWTGSKNHTITIEPALRWQVRPDVVLGIDEGIGAEVNMKHDWRLRKNWIFTNTVGLSYFPGNRATIAFRPELKFQSDAYSISAYLQETRNFSSAEPDAITGLTQRLMGGELNFYKLDFPNKTFELALNGEYAKRPNNENDMSFGVRLDIAH